MASYINLMAKRFGKLLVIDGPIQRKTKGGQSKTAWLCLCDCGNKVQRDSQQLRANQSTHCGCNKKLPTIKYESLIGQKFGRLRVVEESDMIPNGRNGARQRAWRCLCDCGKLRNVRERMLKTGRTKSCGCLSVDVGRARAKPGRKANGKVSPEYQAWRGMKTRCLNSNHPKYYLWGGRGIKICEEWINDFDAFLEHVGFRPSPDMSIDRIDVNGNYEPGNVRWATPSQQSLNRRPYKRRA